MPDIIARLNEVFTAEFEVAHSQDMRPQDTANYGYATTCREAVAEIKRLRALVMLGDFSSLRPNSDSFKLVQQIRREQSTGEQLGDGKR